MNTPRFLQPISDAQSDALRLYNVDAAPNCSTEASRKTVTELAARLLAEFQTAFPGLTLKRSPVWEEHPDILGTQVVPLPSTNPA